MALHAKVLKHNILRVSKLKSLSNTTLAIERNFDRNPSFSLEHSKNLADQGPLTSINFQKENSDIWSLPVVIVKPDAICDEKPKQDFLHFGFEQFLAMHFHPHLMLRSLDRELSKTNVFHGERLLDSLTFTGAPWIKCTAEPTGCQLNTKGELIVDAELYEKCEVSHLDSIHVCKMFDRNPVSYDGPHFSHQQLEQSSNDSSKQSSLKPCDHHNAELDVKSLEQFFVVDDYSDLNTGVVLCTHSSSKTQKKSKVQNDGKPNIDRLKAVEQYFIEKLPTFFKSRQDYRIYHPDIVFENNFWGENIITMGINQYAIQLVKLRAMVHLKYAYVNMEVISTRCILEESMVRIHWRIAGLSQFRALRFWKYAPWKYSSSFKEDAEWIDGISLLYVNKDGLVTKHRIDRMTPDEEQPVKAPTLATKLALMLGLSAPKASLSDFSSLLFRR